MTIREFYKGSNVLVTGGTGFLGKVIVEKLLRTCDLGYVYLLVRPMKGLQPEERIQKCLENPIFKDLKTSNPQCLDKIKIVEGDLLKPRLGLSDEDLRKLKQEVNVIIHCAATVRFDEPLKKAIRVNVTSLKELLDIALEIQNLKKMTYVSTAFINFKLDYVQEMVYDYAIDPAYIIKWVETLPEKMPSKTEKQVLGDFPNTYTFSKAVAETLVEKYSNKLPLTIIRPSIVTPTWKEPVPGWIDNLMGANGIIGELANGRLRYFPGSKNARIDLVPVDIVANSVIAAAWHSTTNSKEQLKIYSCTSGETNPIYQKDFIKFAIDTSRDYPGKCMFWYPRHFHQTYLNDLIYKYLVHRPIAIVTDIKFRMRGKKPVALKVCKMFESLSVCVQPIIMRDFILSSKNMVELSKDLEKTSDAALFNVNFTEEKGFDWKEYYRTSIYGLRKYVYKDDTPEDCQQNKILLRKLYWFDMALKFGGIAVLFLILWIVFWIL